MKALASAINKTTTKNLGAGFKDIDKTLTTSLNRATKSVLKFNQSMNKLKMPGARVFGDPAQAEAYARRISDSYSKMIPANKELRYSIGKTADGWKVSSMKMVDSSNKMAEGFKSGARGGIRGLLSLQSFVAKIAHYITFSIGVQMVMGIRRGIESAIENFEQFEKSIYNAASVSGYLGAAFNNATEDLARFSREVVKGTIFTASDASKSLYDLASAGYDVVDMARQGESGMEAFRAIMDYAAATASDLGEATASVVAVMRQFNIEIENVTEITDTFTALITSSFLTQEKLAEVMKYTGSIAGILGQELSDTASAAAVLANRGMEGGQVGQRLNMIFTKLLKPTDKAKQMLYSMGLTLNDINPQFHSLTEILYTLQAAQFGAAEAATFFRARTAGAAISLVNAADEVSAYSKRVKMSMGITQSVAEKQASGFAGAMAEMRQSLHEASIELGQTFAPVIMGIKDVLEGTLLPALKTLGQILSSIAPYLKIIITLLISYMVYLKSASIWSKHLAAANLTLSASLKAMAISFGIAFGKAMAFNAIILGLINIITGKDKVINGLAMALSALGIVLVVLTKKVTYFSTVLHGALGPIGWVMAAIGGLIAIVSSFNDESKTESEELKKVKEVLKDMEEDYKSNESVVNKYKGSVEELVKALEKQIDARKKLRDLEGEGGEDTIDYTVALQELDKISAEVLKEEEEMIKLTSYMINNLKSSNTEVDEAVTAYIKWRDSTEDIADKTDQLNKLRQRETELTNKLVDVQSTYTTNSEEYRDVYNELDSAIREREALQKRIRDVTEDSGEAENNYNTAIENTDGSIKEAIDLATRLYDVRATLLNKTGELNELETQRTILYRVQQKYDTYLEEGAKKLREQKEKLYEIEYKQYKLQKEKTDRLDELFEALAAEGMLTQDIIDAYVDKKKAEGESIKAGVDLAGVLGDLSAEGQDLVTDWLEVYLDSLKEGKTDSEAMNDANNAIPGTLSDVVAEGTPAYQTIFSYADAAYAAWENTEKLDDIIVPFTDDLYENGIASGNVADKLNAITTAENTQLNLKDEYIQALQDITNKGLQPLIDTAAKMWVALGGFKQADFGPFDLSKWENQLKDLEIDVSKNIIFSDTDAAAKRVFNSLESVLGPKVLTKLLSYDLPDIITEDWLNQQGVTTKQIEELRLSGNDMIDKDSIEKAKKEFIDSLYNLNKETGYFADTTADSATVLDAYLKYVSKYVDETEAYSSGTATAATTMKYLTSIGYEEDEVLKMVGGKFSNLKNMSNTALSGIITDTETATTKIDGLKDEVANLQKELTALTLKPYEIIVNIKVEEEKKEEKKSKEHKWTLFGWDVGKAASDLWKILNPDLPGVAKSKTGGIMGLQKGIKKTKGPTPALIGEAGAEAVIPLEGTNKKYGAEILTEILPLFMSELGMQGGGLIGAVQNVLTSAISTSINTSVIYDLGYMMAEGFITAISVLPMLILTSLYQGLKLAGIQWKADIIASGKLWDTAILKSSDTIDKQVTLTFTSVTSTFKEEMNKVAGNLVAAGIIAKKYITDAANDMLHKIKAANITITVQHTHSYSYNILPTRRYQEGGIVSGPQFTEIGENGPEAVIPLTGTNKKFGKDLLEYIIPKYYPELTAQTGGLYGNLGGGISNIEESNNTEQYNIMGDIYLPNVNNVEGFMDSLKKKARITGAR